MAVKKDGSSRSSASYMPYDSSDSFVKKIANKVTGLVSWRSQSQSSVISQNYDNCLSNSMDEDNVSPTLKRIRVQCEEDDTLLRLIPSTSKGPNEVCSSIQPINNKIKTASINNRNQCFISSTRRDIFSSTVIQTNSKHQTRDSNMTDTLDNNEFENTSLTVPQFSVHHRHNVTVPAISRDVPSQVSNVDTSKRAGSFTISNSRRPSFNVDVFMSRRERDVNSLSPFYSARTMYGGASGLLPYGGSSSTSLNRLRSASTSKLNLFAPRSQITIQPVSPSPNNCNNDQETMSASARRILDTLEKHCSLDKYARSISVNELKTSGNGPTSQLTPSKGIKRKLQTLRQMTPSTTDLLRIKRQEEMQDSVSSARHVVSMVLESAIAAEDSDSDSTDLDYSILKNDTDTKNSQKYIGKTRRKDEKKFAYEPLPPLKLPNAKLNITNLPKFDITDTFTFSKPLLLENLESGESIVANTVSKNDLSSQTFQNPVKILQSTTPKNNKSEFARSSVPSSESATPVTPQFLVLPTSKLTTTSPKVGLRESTDESCSSRTSTRTESKKSAEHTKPPFGNTITENQDQNSLNSSPTLENTHTENEKPTELSTFGNVTTENQDQNSLNSNVTPGSTLTENKQPAELPKPPTNEVNSGSSTSLTSGWGDRFKPVANSWECKECFIRNASTVEKCVACASPKPGTSTSTSADVICASAAKFSFNFNKTSSTTNSGTSNAVSVKNPLTNGLAANQEQHSLSNSAFGSFGGPKQESLTNSNVKPAFKFGSNSTAVSQTAVGNQNPASGGFTFGINGPKADDKGLAKFLFGSATNENSNLAPTFGNVVFGSTPQAHLQTLNTSKKSDCFSSQTPKDVNSFTGFGNANTDNQDQNSLISNATPGSRLTENKKSAELSKTLTDEANSGPTTTLTSGWGDKFKSVAKSECFVYNASTASKCVAPTSPKAGINTDVPPADVVWTVNAPAESFSFGFNKTPDTTDSGTCNTINVKNPLTNGSATNQELKNPLTNGLTTNQIQQPLNNSVFGSFGGPKLESQTNSNTAFNFGSYSTALSQTVVDNQQAAGCGGFTFNGPKTDDKVSAKFLFGSVTTNSNSVSTFGSAVFGSTPQTPSQTMNTAKKQGGFSFSAPSQFGSQSVNNFTSFGNASTENEVQDQNKLNSNATHGTTPYIFGSTNLAVPQTMNFTGGNASTTFSAQPATVNNTATGLPQRRIKKATRRIAK